MRILIPAVILAVVAMFTVAYLAKNPANVGRQIGPRGTGLSQIYDPGTMRSLAAANVVPTSVPYPDDEGEKAGDVYENLKVLGDLSTGEFTRLMVNITTWVAPDGGCETCHNVADFAEDSIYTKVVARRMLEMVRHINSDWTEHVAGTGVTCYTCHRGQRVPANIWFNDPGPKQASGVPQAAASQNHPARAVGMSSLPRDPMSRFLEGDADIRIQPDVSRLPNENGRSIKLAENTHGLMVHMSQSLGVNCHFCHNTRSFSDWTQSTPQRKTAWYGIRMVRDLNNNYLNPLRTVFPDHRLGPAMGDAPKLTCSTCHNGASKPLLGESMLPAFPNLKGPKADLSGGQSTAVQAKSSVLYEEPPWN